MAKNRKTVLKGFTYLQCDEFAAYLSNMAAQGWHFKEWGAGLVFEKGEPENAVYAVEVFFKGSDHDLTPSIETLDFADYCEKAGWKLIDSKQKYCIFKQMRPDAVPIVTPQERLQNAAKAYHKQLLAQLLLAVLWIISMAMRLYPSNQLINTIFSNAILIACAFFAFYFVYTFGKYIWFWSWKYRAKKLTKHGQQDILRNTGEKIWNAISIGAVVLLIIGYGISMGLWSIVNFFSVIAAFLLLGIFLGRVRPDKETNVVIQVLFSILLTFTIVISSIFGYNEYKEKQNQSQSAPLTYADLDFKAGAVTGIHVYEDVSLLGNRADYYIFYGNASLSYTIYESAQDWVLDVVWEHNMWTEGTIHGSVTDCTTLWDAEAAFYNGRDYLVRYKDTIIIFRFLKFELTQEHIAIIRDALGLEG